MDGFWQIIFSNFFAFDGLIFILAAINLVIFFLTLKSADKLFGIMHLSVFVPGHRISEKENAHEIQSLSEPKVVSLRQKSSRLYIMYINITAIFPLMGILGTVLSLIAITEDLSNVTSNFFAALTSTFWGLVFSIIFKLLDGIISSKIEDNEKSVDLYLERNAPKTDEKDIQVAAK